MFRPLQVVGFAASIASLLTSAAAGQGTVPDVVRSALSARASEASGYFVYERRRTQTVRAPGHSDVTIVESSRAMDGLKVIGTRIRAASKSGTPSDSAAIAQLQAKSNSALPAETDSDLPIALDRAARFTFGTPQACQSCGADVVKVDFRSIRRDEDGADGFLFIDERNKRLARVEYSPATLAKYVTSAACTVQFGQVLPGVWAMEREEQHYVATRFFVRANIDITITAQQYRRVPSVADALAALKQ